MIKLLVVDDDPSVLRFVRRALEAEGYRVASTTDGLEGVRAALIERPAMAVSYTHLTLPTKRIV